MCDDLPRHVGLWLDVFVFAAIVTQIIIFASPYWSCGLHDQEEMESICVPNELVKMINEEISKKYDEEQEMDDKLKNRLSLHTVINAVLQVHTLFINFS